MNDVHKASQSGRAQVRPANIIGVALYLYFQQHSTVAVFTATFGVNCWNVRQFFREICLEGPFALLLLLNIVCVFVEMV